MYRGYLVAVIIIYSEELKIGQKILCDTYFNYVIKNAKAKTNFYWF